MKILAEILKIEGINSKEDFENFGKEGYKSNFLELTESFISDEKILLENKIINIDSLSIDTSKYITINNCIFVKNLKINPKDLAPQGKIEIENSIFLKGLSISSVLSQNCIEIYNSNFSNISINVKEINKLIIHNSKIQFFHIEDTSIKSFDTENNKIEYLDLINYKFFNINFDFDQLGKEFISGRLENKIKSFSLKETKNLDYKLNLFEFIRFYKAEELKEKLNYSSLNNLIKFAKEETNLNKNKNKLNHVLFWENFISQKNRGDRFFVLLSGAFYYPKRFLYLGGSLFLIFSFIYSLPFMNFYVSNTIRALSFFEALYFSGVSFTTLGYGDIIPLGYARFFALTEAFSGIVLMNMFLVALLKKYIDS